VRRRKEWKKKKFKDVSSLQLKANSTMNAQSLVQEETQLFSLKVPNPNHQHCIKLWPTTPQVLQSLTDFLKIL